MKILNNMTYSRTIRPIRIVQFGEGNFLRAFVDDFLDQLNKTTNFNGNVCVVQPRSTGRVKKLMAQDGLYTLCLEGKINGQTIHETRTIDVLQQGIDPYTEWDSLMKLAEDPNCQIMISNTTEAGIAYTKELISESVCPLSFPGKVLAYLKHRYNTVKSNNNGMWIICCELIDQNADTLKSILIRKASELNESQDFIQWLCEKNHYCNTLVDRIVPGYPKDQIGQISKETGYIDNFVVKGEIYHSWVLQCDNNLNDILPLNQLNDNIIFTSDLTPYRDRKVAILNGCHTCMVPLGLLCGLKTVRETVENSQIRLFLDQFLQKEVWPSLKFSTEELTSFTADVFERFENPGLKHFLMDISLNSISKFNTRNLPAIMYLWKKEHKLADHALFSLSALIVLMTQKKEDNTPIVNENSDILSCWDNWDPDYPEITINKVLSLPIWKDQFDQLDSVQDKIKYYIQIIMDYGIHKAIEREFHYE